MAQVKSASAASQGGVALRFRPGGRIDLKTSTAARWPRLLNPFVGYPEQFAECDLWRLRLRLLTMTHQAEQNARPVSEFSARNRPRAAGLRGWIFRCKLLICNDQILVRLEKFSWKINADRVSLNQRVPGSSPGAPTKSPLIVRIYRVLIGVLLGETTINID